jgi:hypothetical protein
MPPARARQIGALQPAEVTRTSTLNGPGDNAMLSRHPIALLALPLALAGCIDDDDCTTCESNVLYESEVNDSDAQADWIGVLYPGDALSIRGHMTQFGPDHFDGFAFVTGAPMQIDVALWADVPGVDLDLCVWDPVFSAFVTCFETAAHPEGGNFVVLEEGKEIHLVVRSFQGDSAYWLDVFGQAAVYGAHAAPTPLAPRVPGAWDAYVPQAEPHAETALGREAVLYEFAADGTPLESRPARLMAWEQR